MHPFDTNPLQQPAGSKPIPDRITLPVTESRPTNFETGQVLTVVSGHFVHDTYTAFIATLLPKIIEKLSLSLTQAGSLTAILQIGALLNPFIGYMADKFSLRYFVIFAPAITATLICSISFANSYYSLAILFLVTGISVAAFHAPAPAMIAGVSHRKVGLGMSLFMAGGELGRTIGPLLVVWAVTTWTLDGFYRVVVLGWAASAVLFFRLRGTTARPARAGNMRLMLPYIKSLFLPLLFILLFRDFMLISLSVYLPTFMSQNGSSLWVAGASLSILEVAGVAGALLSGTISDTLGRRSVLFITTVASSITMLFFLRITGWLMVPALLILGFTALSTMPVLLALVQEHFPNNRSVANGMFMLINFLMQMLATLSIGSFGDRFGLNPAFFWSAIASLLALPPILFLPKRLNPSQAG